MQIVDLSYYIGILLISVIIYAGFISFPVVFIMYLLMPKEVLNKYFKPPYFSETEVAFFTGLPFFMMRTAMFMTAFAFPEKVKKRGLSEAYLIVPVWYRRISKFCTVSVIASAVIFFPALIFICTYFTYTGEMEWF